MEPSNVPASTNPRKTKAQLIEELERIRSVLSEKEETIEELRELLESTRAELEAARRQTGQLDDLSTKLEESEAFAEEMTTHAQKLEEELAQWKERAAADPARDESVGPLQRRILELEEIERTLRSRLEEPPEAIEASKATFKIEIYPRNGGYHGRIQHLLSKDQKTFKGLDKETIYEFLHSHRPQSESEVKSDRTGESDEAMVIRDVLQIRSLELHAPRASHPGMLLPSNVPFRGVLSFDTPGTAPDAKHRALEYDIQVLARRIGAHDKHLVAERHTTTTWGDLTSEHFDELVLKTGTYRFETIVRYRAGGGEATPMIAFHESDPIRVQ